MRKMLLALSLPLAWSIACATGETPATDAPADAPPGEAAPAPAPATGGLAGTGTKDDPFVLDCETKARDLTNFEAGAFVKCPDGCASGGSIWGTCQYTFDTSVCRAAIHAGALAGAGQTRALHQPGQEKYTGSEANGVTSNDWGSYADSLSFQRMTGACAPEGGTPAPGRGGKAPRPR